MAPTEESALRDVFDANEPLTVGIEEEVILVERESRCPAPVAERVVAAADHPSVKSELPACQVELVTEPHAGVEAAMAELGAARRLLVEACGGPGGPIEPMAAAVHPWAPTGPLGTSARHHEIEAEFGEIAHRQLVGSLQVHVAVGSADATIAVYDALRGYLPELAALAASAPFHEGRDLGLASVRPIICGQLPRQGVPPALGSWEHFAGELAWGAAGGAVTEPRRWWWELRPHVVHGTLEVRVPDVQASIADADAVVRTVHALVAHLLDRHEAGDELEVAETWRIEENRWRALRDGVHGELLDLTTGAPLPTPVRLHRMLDAIEPHSRVGSLDGARALVRSNGADRLREVGVAGAPELLVTTFPPEVQPDVR